MDVYFEYDVGPIVAEGFSVVYNDQGIEVARTSCDLRLATQGLTAIFQGVDVHFPMSLRKYYK